MNTLTEPLDGGLVTGVEPRLLNPGQLQQADDVVYFANSPGVRRAPGRTSFGVVTAGTPVKGLAFLAFAQGNVLLAFVQTVLKTATFTALTGIWSTFKSSLTNLGTEKMDVVAAGSRYWWCDGIDPNMVISYSGNTLASRAAGMNTVGAGFLANIIVGTWPTVYPYGVGTYFFLLTEAYRPSADAADEVESSYTGPPVAVTLATPAAQGIQIVRDATTKKWNDGSNGSLTATHFYVYISPVQTDASTTPALTSYVRVGGPTAIDGTAGQAVTLGGTGNYASANIQATRSARSTQVMGAAGTWDAFTTPANLTLPSITTLTVAMINGTDTLWTVASSAALVAGMVVRVEGEQVKISSIPGGGLTFNSVAGRGYNNTTAAAHINGSTVYQSDAVDLALATATRPGILATTISAAITTTGQTDIRLVDRSAMYVGAIILMDDAATIDQRI